LGRHPQPLDAFAGIEIPILVAVHEHLHAQEGQDGGDGGRRRLGGGWSERGQGRGRDGGRACWPGLVRGAGRVGGIIVARVVRRRRGLGGVGGAYWRRGRGGIVGGGRQDRRPGDQGE